MSQSQLITLTELKEWLMHETAPIIEPLRDKGTRLLEEIERRLNDAIESDQRILESSQREMEKNHPKTYRFARNANKFGDNLLKMLESKKIPENISFDDVQEFCNDMKRLIVTTEQLRREAYRYITPYFIFDRRRLDATIKRLQDINNELDEFLTTKYVDAKTVEDAPTMVDKLIETLNQANENTSKGNKVQQMKNSIEAKIQETQKKIVEIQNRDELTELIKTEEKMKELRRKVKHNLRYLQKPFLKILKRSRDGYIAISVDEVTELRGYLSDPFKSFATEKEGYPTLRSLLNKLNEAINQNIIKLKTSRLRKAQEQIDNILSTSSLDTLHKNCEEVRSQGINIMTSNAVVQLQNKLAHLQTQLKDLQKESEFTSSKAKALENEHKNLKEKIGTQKKELERIVFQLTDKNIHIVLT
jgi:hypothetical protein